MEFDLPAKYGVQTEIRCANNSVLGRNSRNRSRLRTQPSQATTDKLGAGFARN
jgi:hypothetical protein